MRILCATDLLPKSEAAIARAGLMSDRLGADLTLLHIVSDEQSPAVQEKELQDAFARAKTRAEPVVSRAHRTAAVTVRVGDPASNILDAAWQAKAQLLILGPHHKRPLRDTLEGTILEKALAARRFPVLVVRNEVKQPYRRVLIAVNFSESSLAALRAAESLDSRDSRPLTEAARREHRGRQMARFEGLDLCTP